MNTNLQIHFQNLWTEDRDLQNEAFTYILESTNQAIDWVYEIWDETVKNLTHKDNHNRAIAAQVLCNLAKSDSKERIFKDFKKLLAVTKDEKFVTARHCMQALWKVGIVSKKHQQLLINGLEDRFKECVDEKNYTLIRYDILQSLRNVYDIVQDEKIKIKALVLIETETDIKYKKKYLTLWKRV